MAETNKKKKATTAPKEAEIIEPKPTAAPKEERVREKKRHSWSVGALFWGLLLVTIGGLLLLNNLGVLEVNFVELWRLWPLLIIAGGFSVLATTHWLWKLLAVVFVAITIAAVILLGTGQYGFGTPASVEKQETTISKENNVTSADIEISAGASELNLSSSDNTDRLVKASLDSKWQTLTEDSEREGTVQKIKLSSENRDQRWFNPAKSTWDVTLTEQLPLSLTVDAGASSIDADLSQVRLTALKLKAGASSSDVKLGDKEKTLKVTLDSGASSMTLRIPKGVGVSLVFDGGLSSKDLADLKEVSKDNYRSENYDAAEKKIDIVADMGVASFTIQRY